jgi:AhpD family alkylhydroperoxidase
MTNKISQLLLACLLLLGTVAGASAQAPTAAQRARADIEKTFGFVPDFFKAFPDAALPGAWEEMKGLQMNPNTSLSGRTKELIGLAVAAQVPCRYCVYAHTEFAKLNGATPAETGEAVALGGLERHASAYFYGLSMDEAKARAELLRLIAMAKKNKPAKQAAPIEVVDAKTALADIAQTFGFVPALFHKVPASALPGMWREMKELKLGTTAVSARDKALISLAVASQVPSEVCIEQETELAKLAGATEREIGEAVGMAAITRNMSTLLNGLQLDETKFRADIDRLVTGAKNASKKTAQK